MHSGFWNVLSHPVSLVTAGIASAASEVGAILGPIFSLKDQQSYATCCDELTTQIAAQFCGNTTASSALRDDFCANLLSKSYLWWLAKAGIVLVPAFTIGSMCGVAYRVSKIAPESMPLVEQSTPRSSLTEKCIKVLTSKPFIVGSFLALFLSGAGAWICSDFAKQYINEVGKNCIEGATLNLTNWPHTETNTSMAERISYCVIERRDLQAFSIAYYVSMGLLPASALGIGSTILAQSMRQKHRESSSRVTVDNAGADTDT